MAQITLNSSGVASSGTLALQSNGTTTAVTVDTAQNVGVGTTSPTDSNNFGRALDIRSSTGAGAYFRDSDDATKYALVGFFGSDGNAYYGSWGTSTGVLFYSSGAERARIDVNGNLGVGTSGPVGKVESKTATIAAASANYAQKAFVANLPYSTSNVIGSMLSGWDGSSIHGVDVGMNYNGTGYDMIFSTNDNTSGSPIERARIDSSGNLGIGTTSPTTRVHINGSGGQYFRSFSTSNSIDLYVGAQTNDGTLAINSNHPLTFITNSNERARITEDGNLLVGTVTAADGKVRISASANAFNILKIDDTGSTTGNYVQFLNSAGSQAGAINHSGTTSVSYNSGSDYRLKNITGPVTNAIGFINSLKPKVGTWKEDGSKFVGFLAHEFAEVCPQAVQGEKDAVDADGKPLYQSMEASSPEVIANIVALLQEQQALITQLQADVAALKA